jgi:hypothetical protein
MAERPAFLVVGVIYVPNSFGRFALVVGCFHCCRQQHGAKDTRTPSRPPFGHLVDGLTCVALDNGYLIDRDDGKVHFETGIGAIRVGEVHRLDRNLATRAHRECDLLKEQFLLGFDFGLGHVYDFESSINGTATSSSDNPPCASVG